MIEKKLKLMKIIANGLSFPLFESDVHSFSLNFEIESFVKTFNTISTHVDV